jgi:hypothetical protein
MMPLLHDYRGEAETDPVHEAVASHDVQWLLRFQLACYCQQVQHETKQQQQQQQQQPYEQLFAALGLTSSVQYSRFFKFDDDRVSTEVLLAALLCQIDATGRLRWLVNMDGSLAAEGAADAAPNSSAAAAAAASVGIQQQQQQGWIRLPPLSQPGDCELPRHNTEDYCRLPPHLVQPLVLTLLQLCSDFKPMITLILPVVRLADDILLACLRTSGRMQMAAKLKHSTVVGPPDCPEAIAGEVPTEQLSALEAITAAYSQTLGTAAQPLLHVVGPAVLKAVWQVEQNLSKGVVNNSIRMLQGQGMSAEQSAVKMVDETLDRFGRLVLHVILEGESDAAVKIDLLLHVG